MLDNVRSYNASGGFWSISCDWEDTSRARRVSKVVAVDKRKNGLGFLLDSGARGRRDASIVWNGHVLGFSASSSLKLRRAALRWPLSLSTTGVMSIGLPSKLFLRRRPFCGVSPGSLSARENISFKFSRVTLEVLEPKRAGSASESASDEDAGGGTGVVSLGGRGSRARRARRRAAGVSAGTGVALEGVGNEAGVGSGLREAIGLGCMRGVGNSSSSS